MEDIVAIKVTNKKGKKFYFITWGRTFDTVNPRPLLKEISKHLEKFGIHNVKSIHLAKTLLEASEEIYFYESFFEMAQKRIPFGKKYKNWCNAINKKIMEGKEVYLVTASKGSK